MLGRELGRYRVGTPIAAQQLKKNHSECSGITILVLKFEMDPFSHFAPREWNDLKCRSIAVVLVEATSIAGACRYSFFLTVFVTSLFLDRTYGLFPIRRYPRRRFWKVGFRWCWRPTHHVRFEVSLSRAARRFSGFDSYRLFGTSTDRPCMSSGILPVGLPAAIGFSSVRDNLARPFAETEFGPFPCRYANVSL